MDETAEIDLLILYILLARAGLPLQLYSGESSTIFSESAGSFDNERFLLNTLKQNKNKHAILSVYLLLIFSHEDDGMLSTRRNIQKLCCC